MSLTGKQEKFAQCVVKNGGDKVAAYKEAGYSCKGNTNTVSKAADDIYNNPKVYPRIKELQKKAIKAYTVSLEQRIKWLEEVAKAGLETFHDQNGNPRRENLSATCKAVNELNGMLGLSDTKDKEIQPINIGVVDAS